MPEAQAGVRRSPCAAVTNTASPASPQSLPSYLPLSLEGGTRVSSGKRPGPELLYLLYGPAKTGDAAPRTPGSSYLAYTLSSQAKALFWAKPRRPAAQPWGMSEENVSLGNQAEVERGTGEW